MRYLLLLLASSLFAQTYGSLTVNQISYNSARLSTTLSSGSYYVSVQYGVASAACDAYPYRTGSYSRTGSSDLSVALYSLPSATTIYYRWRVATATPGTSVCSSEGTFTTLAQPTVTPETPTPPTTYNPTLPDTSAYTVISFNSSGLVSANSGPCTSGQTIQACENALTGYGFVFEFPQSVTIAIAGQGGTQNKGISLKGLGTDGSSPHRYVVYRTAGTATDFPPDGVRASATLSAKCATLEAQNGASSRIAGQVFDTSDADVKYRLFQNLCITHRSSVALYPTNMIYGAMFGPLIGLTNFTAAPSNIIIDRVRIYSAGAPSRAEYGVTIAGTNIAIINSEVTGFSSWKLGTPPAANPTGGSTTLTIPAISWRRVNTDSLISVSATTAVAVPTTPAATTYRLYTNSGKGYTNNCRLEYITPASGSLSITSGNCSVAQVASYTDAVDDLIWQQGDINTAGQMFPTCNTTGLDICDVSTTGVTAGTYTSQAVQILDGSAGSITLDNNTLEAYGLIVAQTDDATVSPNDVTVTRNQIWQSTTKLSISPNSDGRLYKVRNMVEWKAGQRWQIKGNRLEGGWAGYGSNDGYAVFFNARQVNGNPASTRGALQDVTVASNSISHGGAGIMCWGNAAGTPDAGYLRKVHINNNLLYQINRFDASGNALYNDTSAPGNWGGPIGLRPGCGDVRINNNYFGRSIATAPGTLYLGGGYALSTSLAIYDNVFYLGTGSVFTTTVVTGEDSGGVAPLRLPTQNFASTAKAALDLFAVRTGASVTPDYSYLRNVHICGSTGFPTAVDADSATCTTLDGYMGISGNYLASGNTIAARETAAGLLGTFAIGSGPYSATAFGGKPAGFDRQQLLSDQGVVQSVSVVVGDTYANVSYTAPDSRACSVEAVNGATVVRATDAGGTRQRTTILSGLTAATAYTFRTLCYFEQLSTDPYLNSWPSDQITRVAATTSATAPTVSTSIGFALGTAADLRISGTLADGPALTPVVCASSPCSVGLKPGRNALTLTYRNGGAVTLRSAGLVVVR